MAGRHRRLDQRTALGPADVGGGEDAAPAGDLAGLAAEAFVYGLPLASTLGRVERLVEEGIGAVPAAPLNSFGHAERPAGPEGGVALVDAGTLHSVAAVDLSGGPVELEVPDGGGRYYVLQLIDAWANSFAYVGRRATGTEAGSFLLVGPDYDGPAQGATLIRCPTAIVTIVGRWAFEEGDLAAVRELQAQLTLTPLGRPGNGLPLPAMAVSGELRFFEQLRVWIRAFPPAPRDLDYQQRFASLGLFEPMSPFADPTEEIAAAMSQGLAAGRARIERASAEHDAAASSGWRLDHHACDYNLDFLELGTRREPEWLLAQPARRHLARAIAARDRPWGAHGYEIAEATAEADGKGKPLDGAHRYELRLPPPAARWSLSAYDAADSSPVANPIERHAIGAHTPGLDQGADGSLRIAIQHGEPDSPAARANWLPAPAGPFRLVLRLYEPHEAALAEGFAPPPLSRAA